MPRPRRDPEVLPAQQRLENAFWALLRERPYGKITVTDIVREAGVNRNSFYYHFSGLPELADATIMHAVESIPIMDHATSAENLRQEWQRTCIVAFNDPQMRKQFDHLALLAGPHSTIELTEALRDFIRLTLLGNFDMDYDHVDLSTRLLLDFTVGGIVGVLRDWPNIEHRLSTNDLTNPDIATVATNLRTALAASTRHQSTRSLH